jgi:lipoprotein-anchoring transpeptidase ErfK/SrfK
MSETNISTFKRVTKWGAALALVTTVAVAGTAAARSGDHAITTDPPLHVTADLGARKLYLQIGDSTVETFPVAIGKDSKPTPRGVYRIRKIIWNPAWVPPDEKWAKGKKPQPPGAKGNPMKLVKIFFKEPDYYIHGTDQLESLGEAESHGCLRMNPDDAYQVARYLMDHGGSPRDESWFWRVLHFRSETKTVYLDNPIEMTVD